MLREASLKTQHEIAEAAANSNAAAGSIEQKVGALYKAGMDEAAIDALGAEPPAGTGEDRCAEDPADVVAYLGDSYSRGLGSLFYFGAETDFKNSQRKIAYAFQGGLGLPTPDYYQKDEHAKIRDAYLAHIATVGTDRCRFSCRQQTSRRGARLRDGTGQGIPAARRTAQSGKPEGPLHRIADADKVTPHFEWGAFFKAQNADVTDGFSLSQPKFLPRWTRCRRPRRGRLAGVSALPICRQGFAYLSAPFQQEHFAFHKQTLNGQKEN